MSATQRARPGVPPDLRSALPSMPGIPAWGAVAVAAGAAFVGFAIDAVSGNELTGIFSVLYFLGCLAAVVAVRYRGLFTAVVQPPLLLFVAVPLGQQILSENAGTSLKDLALTVAYPLVDRFPLMLATTVVVALIAGARIFLAQQQAPPVRSRRNPSRPARPPRSGRADTSTRTADSRRRGRNVRREPIDDRSPRRPSATDPRVPRSGREPVSSPGHRDTVRSAPPRRDGRHEPIRRDIPRRDTAYGEPVARDREPIPRDPIPTRGRPVTDVPAHPMPQVRYRDRREPPADPQPNDQ